MLTARYQRTFRANKLLRLCIKDHYFQLAVWRDKNGDMEVDKQGRIREHER